MQLWCCAMASSCAASKTSVCIAPGRSHRAVASATHCSVAITDGPMVSTVRGSARGRLVFANLDGKAPPLNEVLEDIPQRVAPFHGEAMQFVTTKSWDLACNPLRAMHGGNAETRRYDPAKTAVPEALYVWLFPNMMLNIYLGQMQTNLVVPQAHDRCRVIFDWYASTPPSDLEADADWTKLMACRDSGGRHQDLRDCPAKSSLADLRSWPLFGRAREWGAPLPLAATRVPHLNQRGPHVF